MNYRSNPKFVRQKSKVLKNRFTKIAPKHVHENLQNTQKIEPALNKISPPWVQTDPQWIPPCDDNEFLSYPFDLIEFNVTLESKNKKSSPGMDGIDFDIIVRLPLKFKLLLLDIYNEMYTKMEFPDSWKKVFVHFIDKPDGDTVRPISLTPCLCKLFETLVKNRVQWWAKTNNMIPSSQTGFRKGMSCSNNLTNLNIKIKEAFSEKKELLAAFLDVKGAFDGVIIDILLQTLASLGCPKNLVFFIKFLTNERLIYTSTSGDLPRLAYKGVRLREEFSVPYCTYCTFLK